MNKKIMILWGFIIFGLILSILFIGLSQKDLKYFKTEMGLKYATRLHIKNKDIKTKLNEYTVIFTKELKESKYVNKSNIEEYCIDNVVYYNGLFFDKYTINKKCE